MSHQFYPRRQLLEIASWQLVSELVRRHPDAFSVIEAHPSGGQSDCLALCAPNSGINVAFNRPGSGMIFSRFDLPSMGDHLPDLWTRMMSDEHTLRQIVEDIERASGLPLVEKLPSTNRKTLSFRVMSYFMRTSAFSVDIREWRNGFHDTAGFGGGVRTNWFEQYPQLKERLRHQEKTDFMEEPAYRFWFLIEEQWSSDNTMVCIETTGWVHYRDGKSIDLMKEFKKAGRNIQPVVANALGQFAPER